MMRALIFLATLLCCLPAVAESIVLASTTSTQNSGLLDYLLAEFANDTDIEVKVVAVGTGQALRIARNGDADVLLVHHRASEDAFVSEGFGIKRHDVMYNDFVIVGPKDDPAGVKDAPSAADALSRIASQQADFISRGDDSGTHKKELELWQATETAPRGAWYREIGAGMGAALNMATSLDAYLLTDRGTWITFGNKAGLELLVSGDRALFNPYGVILVNPAKHPHVNAQAGQRLIDWLISPRGQDLIGDFQIDGRQAFCPVSSDKDTDGVLPLICPADG